MEDENEYKKLPTEEKCIHKLWKARLAGYEEAIKLFNQIDNEKSPEWNKYLGHIKKFVCDSNAVAQEKGLEAALVFVENCGHAGKTVGEVMAGIVSKCIAASRTKTKELALQITLMYIEIEKHEIVQEELMKGMDQKNPKVVSACISALDSALKQFGNKVITIKPMVKKIPVLLADRDKGVRDEMKALVVEMHRWIGPAIEPHIASLQPVVQQELRAAFTNVDPPRPTRYLRSQQPKETVHRDNAAEGGSEEDETDDAAGDAAPVDPYDLMDPVNILAKLPKDFYDKLEHTKWQERKEALDSLEGILKTAHKLEPGDYADLVRALKKIVTNDKNVMVIALGVRLMGQIAAGLRGRFQPYAAVCIQALLEKFKEKKANVVQALREAIDHIYPATNLEVIMEDVLAAFENKNPSVKSETALFLARSLCVTQPAAFNKKLLKSYIPALMKLLESADPTVRDAAAEALGTASKLVGEKNIAPHIGKIDNLKQQKITEAAEKAEIKVKTAASKPAKAAPAPAKAAPKAAPEHKAKPVKKPPGAKKPGSATSAVKKTSKACLPRELELTPEDVDDQATELIGAAMLNELCDTNWKTRLSGVQSFHNTVQGLSDGEVSAQLLLRVINKKPGLKDTNVQVARARFDTVKTIMGKFTVTVTALDSVIQEIVSRLGEASFQPVCSECLLLAAGACGLGHVCGYALSYAMDTQKNPKVQTELFNWIGHAVQTIGYGELQMETYLSSVRRAVSATNPAVRSSAIALVGVLTPYAGPALTAAFAGEKPAVRQAIQQEQAKHEAHQISKSGSQGSMMDESEEMYEDAEEDTKVVTENAPLTDLAPLITETLLAEINDKNWKVRNEGLEKLKNIITSAGPIKSSLGDLPQTLAGRLLDSNSKLVQTTLQICESLAEALGPRCKQHIRTLVPGFFMAFGDNKQWVRSGGLKTVDAWVKAVGGAQHVFEGELVLDALKAGSPLLKTTLLIWLAENLPNVASKSFPREELSGCVCLLFASLEDRNADVRRAASDCVLPFMLHLGYENMHKQMDKLKPASKATVQAALDKARPNLPVQPLPPTSKGKKEDTKTVKSAGAVKKENEKKIVKGKAPVRPSTAGNKKKDDEDTSPLLPNNNAKNQRIVDDQKLKVLKWNFTTPREEFFDLLKEQMNSAGVNKQLIINMFHADFRYHLKAIESLTEDLPENGSALMCNLDLVLKWHTLRFFDTNPSVILKGLEYLSIVFQYLIDSDYTMAEYEANCFIPYLVQKVGDPKDTVRNAVKALFKQICVVYSVTKLFSYLMEGLKSKNARQRAECLECICHLVEQYGSVVAAGTALKEVARHISDRDNAVRSAALNAVAAVYFLDGERVFKTIGQISDKDMSLLEERIKRAAKSRSAEARRAMVVPLSATGKPVTQTPSEPEPPVVEMQEEPEEDEEEEEEPAPAPPPTRAPDSPTSIIRRVAGPLGMDPDVVEILCAKLPPMPAPLKYQEIDISFLDEPIPVLTRPECYVRYLAEKAGSNGSSHPTVASAPNQDDSIIVNTIHLIGSPDIEAALRALSIVQSYLRSDNKIKLASYAGRIATALASQLARLDQQHPNFPTFLFSLITLLDCNSLCVRIETSNLMSVIRMLLRCMSVPQESGANQRALNSATTRIIDNADHTFIWCALISLLHESLYEQEPAYPMYQEFLLKCMWKVLRSTPNWELDSVSYDAVLHKVHMFYNAFPQSYWKNKPPKGDTPYRTIKTLVHTLVKKKGVSLVNHLTLIPNAKETELYAYILRIFKSLNLDMESLKENTPESGNNNPGTSDKATLHRLPRHVHDQLASILNQIGHKNDHEALEQLYELREKHPGVDIWTFMQDSSYHYRNYVERCLKAIADSKNKIKLHPRTHNWDTNVDLDTNMDNAPERDAYYYIERLRHLQKQAGMKQTSPNILRLTRPDRADVINDNLLLSRPHSIDPQLELKTTHAYDTQSPISQRNEADLDAIRMKLQQIKESINSSKR